jgi:hypothetical protein
MVLIKLSDAEIAKCRNFAAEQYRTSRGCYARRGQVNRGVILKQIEQGKLAELATYKFLIKKNFRVDKPDFCIYTGREKGYGADLTDGTLNFSIKTQSQIRGMEFGISWIMQKRDTLITKPKPNDIVVLTTIGGPLVQIVGLITAETLKQKKLYKQPKSKHLRSTKVALYLNDVKEHLL